MQLRLSEAPTKEAPVARQGVQPQLMRLIRKSLYLDFTVPCSPLLKEKSKLFDCFLWHRHLTSWGLVDGSAAKGEGRS